ncbi:MAG: hypothetical protein KBC17_01470 [Candidatus Pacebacteria bacterium]|nr:hypothetical protein [Candidatus Paceibacterota bacterium]
MKRIATTAVAVIAMWANTFAQEDTTRNSFVFSTNEQVKIDDGLESLVYAASTNIFDTLDSEEYLKVKKVNEKDGVHILVVTPDITIDATILKNGSTQKITVTSTEGDRSQYVCLVQGHYVVSEGYLSMSGIHSFVIDALRSVNYTISYYIKNNVSIASR